MEKQRLQYLDEIKGFAIFLMVFAHTIAWNFEDWRIIMNPDILTPGIMNAGFLWHFIYSFHMALFFLVSGYLTYKINIKTYWLQIIKKRSIRLLIPYFMTGWLITILRPGFGYWFLFSLWELSVLTVLILLLIELVNKKNHFIIDLFIIVFFYYVLLFLLNLGFLKNPVVDLGYGMNFYLPFMTGVLLRKYPVIETKLNSCLTYVFIVFLLCFSSRYFGIDNQVVSYLMKLIKYTHVTEISGALTFYLIFKQGVNVKLGGALSYLGKHTFEIYILHVFFVFKICELGEFWLKTNLPTCLGTQIVYSSLVSSVAIAISLVIAGFIKHSKLLSKLLFGQ